MISFLIIKNVWNNKLWQNLVLARTTVLCLFFIFIRLLICQKLGQNFNTSLITFFVFSNLGRYRFLAFSKITSFYFELNIFFLWKVLKNDSSSKLIIDANFVSNFSSTILLLSNLSKRSLSLFNNVGVQESKLCSMLLFTHMLIYNVELLIGCMRLPLQLNQIQLYS